MRPYEKAIKYAAMALAILLAVAIIGGIVGAVVSVCSFFGGADYIGGLQTWLIEEDVTELDLELNAAALSVKSGDFRVESNVSDLKVSVKNGKLTVSEPDRFAVHGTVKAVVTVYLPQETVLKECSVEMGAGNLQAETLCARSFSMELGAGNVVIGCLNVSSCVQIDGGAGNLEIKDGEIADLELDMGVGNLYLRAALSGNSTLDLGVGDSRLELIGTAEDYRIKLHKGLGDTTVNGEHAHDGDLFGDGENKLTIDSGVGNVDVEFTEQN